MQHERQFTDEAQERAQEAKKQLATQYRTCFSTDSGKIVLADLKLKFSLDRRRFDPRERNPSATLAAIVEGECNVLRDILAAIAHGDRV
jgi:hypothetical protein